MLATRRIALITLFSLLCLGACSNRMANVLLNVALAAGSSAVSRASGGCYAVCVNSTQCNPSTGFCDPAPCHGQCQADETCERPAEGDERCVKTD